MKGSIDLVTVIVGSAVLSLLIFYLLFIMASTPVEGAIYAELHHSNAEFQSAIAMNNILKSENPDVMDTLFYYPAMSGNERTDAGQDIEERAEEVLGSAHEEYRFAVDEKNIEVEEGNPSVRSSAYVPTVEGPVRVTVEVPSS